MGWWRIAKRIEYLFRREATPDGFRQLDFEPVGSALAVFVHFDDPATAKFTSPNTLVEIYR